MAQAFRIETLDRSGRWYLTPGARALYDLRIRNDSKNAVDCSLIVEEPAVGVSVEPQSFKLGGHDMRTVTVSFGVDAGSVRTHRVLLSLRSDDDGALLATFEHPLVVTGGTDCSLALAWKDAIVEAGELHGFALTCSVRSQSEGPSTFQVSFGAHPAFQVAELPAIALQPGQLGEVTIPVRWDRGVKDDKGSNHPMLLEVGVAVSNGRRTSRMRWEQIESNLAHHLKPAQAAASAVAPQNGHSNGVSTEPAVALDPHPRPISVASAPVPAVAAAPAPAPTVEATPFPTAAPASAPPSVVAPAPEPAVAASAPTPIIAAAKTATPTPAPSPTAKPQSAPMLMLNGHVEQLRLAAPVDARPAIVAASVVEVIELPLFPGMVAPPTSHVLTPSTNGKHPLVDSNSAPSQAAPSGAAGTPPQPLTPPKQKTAAPAPVAQSAPAAPSAEASKATPQVSPASAVQAKAAAAPVVQASAPGAPAAQAAAPTPSAPPAAAPAASSVPTVSAPAPKAVTDMAPQQNSAPAPSAAPANATPPAQTQPAAAAAPATPKLTPYAPAKWTAQDEAFVPAQIASPATPPAARNFTASAADATQEPLAPKMIRERQMVESGQRKRAIPAGFFIGGLAVVALAVAAVLFKPTAPTQSQSTSPVSVATPVLAVASAQPEAQRAQLPQPVVVHKQPAIVKANSRPKAAAPAPHPTPTLAPKTTPRPATPAPTPAPATPKPAAVQPAPVAHTSAPAPVHRPRPAQPQASSVVALGGIEAYYGPRGRAVRVLWSADAQASASVQLIDDRGTTVNTVSVRGGRQSVLMYLPKGFRGGVTIQVSSIGKLGERVAQTTSLPAFSR